MERTRMKIIIEKCMSCGNCEELCPHDAIGPRATIEGMYKGMVIDKNKCLDCLKCLNEADCPGDAIIERLI
jgi:ferredoxin